MPILAVGVGDAAMLACVLLLKSWWSPSRGNSWPSGLLVGKYVQQLGFRGSVEAVSADGKFPMSY